jgi:hypothetical protein
MKCAAVFAIILALTACAVSNTAPSSRGSAEVVASESAGLTGVEQVSIRPSATRDSVVCRKGAPTGSRIAVERCESTSHGDAADKMVHDQMLRDIEEIRMQELRRQQASQNAEAALMRRPPQ